MRAASASASRSAGSEGCETVRPGAGAGAAIPVAARSTVLQAGQGSDTAPGAPHAHPDFPVAGAPVASGAATALDRITRPSDGPAGDRAKVPGREFFSARRFWSGANAAIAPRRLVRTRVYTRRQVGTARDEAYRTGITLVG